METLFNPADTTAILQRLDRLAPDAPRQWGTMTAGQMLAHCTASLETAMGLNPLKRLPLPLRVMGRMLRGRYLGEKPMPKNSPTDKTYVIRDARDFEREKTRAAQRIRTYAAGGAARHTAETHVFFGKMAPEQWARMQWKHFDHHLRQFGV